MNGKKLREFEILDNDSCMRTAKTVVATVLGFQAAVDYADTDPNYTFQEKRQSRRRNSVTGDLEDQ